MKIGPVDTEMALLIVKKKKKLRKVKYIARSAGLPSGLNNNNIRLIDVNIMFSAVFSVTASWYSGR